jgi:hypothetical protein
VKFDLSDDVERVYKLMHVGPGYLGGPDDSLPQDEKIKAWVDVVWWWYRFQTKRRISNRFPDMAAYDAAAAEVYDAVRNLLKT